MLSSISSKYKTLESRLKFKFDQFLYILVGIIIFFIFILMCMALQQPINKLQYQQVVKFSQQAIHPRTQKMAEHVLERTKIRHIHYLKLLNAYQFESRHIRQYPALSQDDE